MCTKIDGSTFKKEAIGWKVVLSDKRGVRSFYESSFSWSPKKVHLASSYSDDHVRCFSAYRGDKVFHCFARREDARRFKRNRNKLNDHDKSNYDNKLNDDNLQIIKVKLSGAVFEGITDGMYLSKCNGLKAICGTKAYWDGEFHK